MFWKVYGGCTAVPISSTTPTPMRLKLIMLGDAGVGKTCIIQKYKMNTFIPEQASTIGPAVTETIVEGVDGQALKIQIWDTAGQERFRSLNQNYYQTANIILIVWDIKNIRSLQDGVQYYVNQCKQFNLESVLVCILGNKADDNSVSDDLQQLQDNFCKKNEIELNFFVSAQTGFNIQEMFKSVLKEFQSNPKYYDKIRNQADKLVKVQKPEAAKAGSSGCCQ